MNEGENIRNELMQIAPGIQWNLKMPAFSIPEDYFREAGRETMARIEIQEAEKSLTRTPAYRVPPGYFDQLPRQVLTAMRDQQKVVSLPRLRRHRHEWAIAAAMAVIVALGGLLSMPGHPVNAFRDAQLAMISDHAIEQYLHTHLNSLNTEDIYHYLDAGDQQQAMTDSFSDQDIENYLNNHLLPPDGL